MRSSIARTVTVVLATAALASLGMPAASAHQHRHVNGIDTTVGWLEEPAYAGFRNAVQIRLERQVGGGDDHGDDDGHAHGEGDTKPVTNASLKVEVMFGLQDSSEKTEAMDLTPAFGVPGEYRAYLIPTQPGTYTFHIFGTVGTKEFDEYYTSGEAGENERSEGQYNDMREPTDVQFPAKAPSAVDLSNQVTAVADTADSADGTAGLAMILAIIGIVVGAGGVATGLAARKGGGGPAR